MTKNYLVFVPIAVIFSASIYFLLAPAGNSQGVVAENTSIMPELYTCPADNCMDVLINLTKEADSVKCAFYDLDLPQLVQAFESSDLELRLVMDYNNYNDNRHLLANLSGNIKTGAPDIQMHNKFCIFDNSIVTTGSFNPTVRGNYDNNNNLLVIHSKYIAENYLEEFDELWEGVLSGGKRVKYHVVQLNSTLVRNFFCPEDCDAGIYTKLIDNASDSVIFMTFSFTNDDIGDALLRAHDRGVVVKGIFEKSQNSRWTEYGKLKDAGIDVYWDKNSANMHHKVFVIDGNAVITGSANPTNNGLMHNDENIIVLYDKRLAHSFLEEFDALLDGTG